MSRSRGALTNWFTTEPLERVPGQPWHGNGWAVSQSAHPARPRDRRRVAVLGVVWIGIPLILFPVAQQWIDSSVAGMLNGGTDRNCGVCDNPVGTLTRLALSDAARASASSSRNRFQLRHVPSTD